MSCGVGRRHGSDLALLWLWRRLAATALIRPLAWEPPYDAGAAQEMAKRRKNKNKNKFKKNKKRTITLKPSGLGVPIVAQWLTIPTRNHEVAGLIPGLAQ